MPSLSTVAVLYIQLSFQYSISVTLVLRSLSIEIYLLIFSESITFLDWIPKMIKGGVRVKAISLAYAFGLDSEFQPHDLLTQHLKESKESCDRKTREASAFPQRAVNLLYIKFDE